MSAGKKTTKGMAVGTLRFDIDLAPPTDDTTNEFSYVHLLKEREAAKVLTTIGVDILVVRERVSGGGRKIASIGLPSLWQLVKGSHFVCPITRGVANH